QGHRPLSTSTPEASSSSVTMVESSLMQEPQPVPALVHFLTSGTVVQECSVTAERTWPLVTLWQLQTTASSGRAEEPSGTGGPAPAGGARDRGGTGSGLRVPASGRSEEYASASPTRMPPSRAPSAVTTSFL